MSVIRYRSKQTRRRVSDMFAENPLPMALTSVGATWLMGQVIRRRRQNRQGERDVEIEFQEDQPLATQRNLYDAGLEAQFEVREHAPGEGISTEGAQQPGVGEQAQQQAGEAREAVSRYGQQARDKASEYRHRAADTGRRIGDQASQVGHQVREQASHISQQVREQAGDIGHRVTDSTQRAQESARHTFQDHPITVTLGLLATGLIVGLALPPTRKEQELVGEQRDELLRQARGYGSDLMERGQAVAQEAGRAASEEPEHQNLTPEQLKAEAEQAGRELRDEAGEPGEQQRRESEGGGLV
ncbi:MAG: hypothetical protein WD009_11685 [Phycisphaeraceae bacterium]